MFTEVQKQGPGRRMRSIESRRPCSAILSRREVVRAVRTAGRTSSATPSAGRGLIRPATHKARIFGSFGISPKSSRIPSRWPGKRSLPETRKASSHSRARSPILSLKAMMFSGVASLISFPTLNAKSSSSRLPSHVTRPSRPSHREPSSVPSSQISAILPVAASVTVYPGVSSRNTSTPRVWRDSPSLPTTTIGDFSFLQNSRNDGDASASSSRNR
mmetsp:Transcript_5505/g.9380  ORF Transcript_5505/g.9380 Transcript_5505/m.9380 type:complete len:216 (-) Transcript_5505:232-879(-)